MEFIEITEGREPYAGEYVYHTPTNSLVICGRFDKERSLLQVLSGGRVFMDRISNFKKVKRENPTTPLRASRGCGGCKK